MSLKGAIGRRIFAKSLPAAPLAAATMGPTMIGKSGCAAPKALCGMNIASAPTYDMAHDEKRKKLDAAREFLYKEGHHTRSIDYFRRRKNNFTVLDPNITALRSVSDQHKIHMHMAAEERLDEERHTWQESILRMFGLTDKRDRYELF